MPLNDIKLMYFMVKSSHLLFLSFVFILVSCVKDGDSIPYEVINYVEVGDSVPEFTVSDEKGNTFNSSDFVGKRSLLILFASTCPDCQEVLPIIDRDVWAQIKDDSDYQLITISRDESAQTVNKYWSKNNYTMPAYLDPGRNVFSLFANSTIPRLYIINEEGVIEWMAIEELNISSEELINKIKVK